MKTLVSIPIALENGVLLTGVVEAVGKVALGLGVSSSTVQETFDKSISSLLYLDLHWIGEDFGIDECYHALDLLVRC